MADRPVILTTGASGGETGVSPGAGCIDAVFANAVMYALVRPAHVDVNEILV
ncbi:hypothetical protein [Marinobacter sp. F3R08]|uniref:hypothetical protein n=1 Tax=Marinobacter sp. F3R08 TaxID=2841559 RepID=UPI001C09910E|nr:hypothetical protein [Marinobacter sp. F3R08]MBU2954218.1 hypothetical protein [Marinobacter sp. F3R08]